MQASFVGADESVQPGQAEMQMPAGAASQPAAATKAKPKPRQKPAPMDGAVLAWVKKTWPSLKPFDQNSIARVLTVIKKETASDGGKWYDETFAPFLAKQGVGGAKFVLERARAARSDAQARDAAKNVLNDALGQKGDDGKPLLAAPPDNGLTGKAPAPSAPAGAQPVPPPAAAKPAPAPSAPAPAGPQGPGDGGGVFAPSPSGPAAPPPAVPTPVDVPNASDDIKRMADLIVKSDDLQKRFADRLFWLIWDDKHEGRGVSFVLDDLRKSETSTDPKVQTKIGLGVQAELKPWVKFHAISAVQLIQIIGLPGISKVDGLSSLPDSPTKDEDGDRLAMMMQYLSRWSQASDQKISLSGGDLAGLGGSSPGASAIDYPIGPLSSGEAIQWPFAFLKDAAANANTLLTGLKKKKAKDNVDRNRQPDNTPGDHGTGGAGSGVKGPGFSRADLYGQWGDYGVFAVGTADQMAANTGRVLSVRMVTEKGSDGKLVDHLAVYDITGGQVYGKTFPINYSGGTIQLKQGGLSYKLSIGDDGTVQLQGSDGTPGRSGGTGPATVTGLLQDRAKRAAAGNVVSIGGQQFYVGAEGVADGGANLYFSKDIIDNLRDGGNAYALTPQALAYVNENVDGMDRLKDDTGKGEVRILDRNGKQFLVGGKPYHLRWDQKANGGNGIFIPTFGAIADPTPPTTGTATGTKTGTGTGTGGGSGSGSGSSADSGDTSTDTSGNTDQTTGDVDAEGWPIVKDSNGNAIPYVHHPAAKMPKYDKIDVNAVNAKLQQAGVDAALYQIDLTIAKQDDPKNPVKPEMYWALIFKNDAANSGKAIFNRGAAPLAVDVIGTALWREDDSSVLYMDLAGGASANGALNEVGTFNKKAAVNNIAAVRPTADNNTGYQVLADILTRAGFADGDKNAVLGAVKRVRENGLPKGSKFGSDDVPVDVAAGVQYQIDGTAAPGKSAVAALIMTLPDGLPRLRLWPTQGVSALAPNPGDADAGGGQGSFAFDKGTNPSSFDGWGSPMTLDGADTILLSLADPSKPAGAIQDAEKNAPGARLYRADKKADGTAGQTWYLTYTIQTPDGKQLQTVPKPVFQNPANVRYAPPDLSKTKLGLAGVTSAAAIGVSNQIFTELAAPYNQNSAKGVYVAKDSPDGKDKHCLGVVLWWGVTDSELKDAAKGAGCGVPSAPAPAKAAAAPAQHHH